jgi:hypothetical protein
MKWDAVIAISNLFIAIGTIILALGIRWSLRSAKETERDNFYACLDNTYFELKKLILDHPHLSNPDPTGKSADELIQYDIFAFMTWNFLESIVDYSKDDEHLCQTWNVILSYEASVHAAWFQNSDNRKRFKQKFLDHIGHLSVCAPKPNIDARTAANSNIQ